MDLLSFGQPLYERYLSWQITRSATKIPAHVALILKEADLLEYKGIEKLLTALLTFRKFKVELVSIYVDILKADQTMKAELASTLGEQLEEIVGGGFRQFLKAHALDLGERLGGLDYESRLVALAAEFAGREIRRVGFDQQPVERQLGGEIAELLRLLES